MLIMVFAADPSFVHFYNATKLLFRLDKGGADFVAHAPSCFVASEAHVPHDLERANPLFAGQHEVCDLEPIAKRLVRILKNRLDSQREPIRSLRGALIALPMVRIARQRMDVRVVATRTFNAIGPTACNQIGAASLLMGKHCLELGAGHLMNRLRLARHGIPRNVEGYYHV